MNFGRDVVLDVVPIRDDQVSSPTSSRIQRVSDAFFCEHLCTKLMNTTFLARRDWIENKVQLQMGSLDDQKDFQILNTGTFSLPVCLACFARNRSIPLLLSTTFLKDPTEPRGAEIPAFTLQTARSAIPFDF